MRDFLLQFNWWYEYLVIILVFISVSFGFFSLTHWLFYSVGNFAIIPAIFTMWASLYFFYGFLFASFLFIIEVVP